MIYYQSIKNNKIRKGRVKLTSRIKLISLLAIPLTFSLSINFASATEKTSNKNWILHTTLSEQNSLTNRFNIIHKFNGSFVGVEIKLSDAEANQLRLESGLESISLNQGYRVADIQSKPTWNLDRLDQTALPLDNQYSYPYSAGQGVSVYIVDSGVSTTFPDLKNIATGYDGIHDGFGTEDCFGHGSHVAGLVASKTFGVAKKATIVPIKVVDCNGATDTASELDGLNWIIAHHQAGTPGVVNMSQAGPVDLALNAEISNLVDNGLFIVASAGNNGANACNYSPGGAHDAFTVGATSSNDQRTFYSNWGSCVDIFAPGENIYSLNVFDTSAPIAEAGTSVSAPQVSGVAALFLSLHPTATPAEVGRVITNAASPLSQFNDGSPALLLSSGVDQITIPSIPTNLIASNLNGHPYLSWAPVYNATDYKIEYKEIGTHNANPWKTYIHGDLLNNLALTDLPASSYIFRISAISTIQQSSTVSTILRTPQLGDPNTVSFTSTPSVPTNIKSLPSIKKLTLSWTAPRGVVSGYKISYSPDGNRWATTITKNTNLILHLYQHTLYSIVVVAYNGLGNSPKVAFKVKIK
jgi:subtilisin family serine protease